MFQTQINSLYVLMNTLTIEDPQDLIQQEDEISQRIIRKIKIKKIIEIQEEPTLVQKQIKQINFSEYEPEVSQHKTRLSLIAKIFQFMDMTKMEEKSKNDLTQIKQTAENQFVSIEEILSAYDDYLPSLEEIFLIFKEVKGVRNVKKIIKSLRNYISSDQVLVYEFNNMIQEYRNVNLSKRNKLKPQRLDIGKIFGQVQEHFITKKEQSIRFSLSKIKPNKELFDSFQKQKIIDLTFDNDLQTDFDVNNYSILTHSLIELQK